jgi:hypothetical protein
LEWQFEIKKEQKIPHQQEEGCKGGEVKSNMNISNELRAAYS